MNQVLPLKKVREELSDLVSRVAYGQEKVVITRFGKPVAALVTYKDYSKILDPRLRFSKDEWDKGFAMIDKIRENTKKFSSKEMEDAIKKAVKEVRQKKHV